MKKEMLKHNVIFYGIQYSLSLLYVGFECGSLNWGLTDDSFRIRYTQQLFVLPAIYLVLMLIGQRLRKGQEYSTGKGYYVMAGVTLVYIALVWVKLYDLYNREYMTITSKLDVIYPAIMAFFSVVIAAFYIACAVKTAMENKKYEHKSNPDPT